MLRWIPSLINWLAKQDVHNHPTETPSPAAAADNGTGEKSVGEHLEDLRRTLIRSALALFAGFNICLLFADRILFFLEAPLYKTVPAPEKFLQSLNVTDSFVLAMQLAFYGGLLLAMPVILYQVAAFIFPALKQAEKRALLAAFIFGALLFLGGVAACYYLMVPQTLAAFIKYSEWLRMTPQWTVESYVGFVTQFMIAVGVTFEVPLMILVLVRVGFLSVNTVRKGRKAMIAAAVILAAILAPPDPLSMIVMILPMAAMFELTIWLASLMDWIQKRRIEA